MSAGADSFGVMSNLLDAMGNEVDAADVVDDARAVELLAEIEPGPLDNVATT